VLGVIRIEIKPYYTISQIRAKLLRQATLALIEPKTEF
jgi:hypothetical protein